MNIKFFYEFLKEPGGIVAAIFNCGWQAKMIGSAGQNAAAAVLAKD
jgi:hypothetical protein